MVVLRGLVFSTVAHLQPSVPLFLRDIDEYFRQYRHWAASKASAKRGTGDEKGSRETNVEIQTERLEYQCLQDFIGLYTGVTTWYSSRSRKRSMKGLDKRDDTDH